MGQTHRANTLNVYTYNLPADHLLIQSGAVVPMADVSFDPWGDFEAQARAAVGKEAVRFSWTNVDLFDVDRLDSDGHLVGTTLDAFTQTLGRGYGVSVRDADKYARFAQLCQAAGTWPKVIQIGSEHGIPQGTDQARFDHVRVNTIKQALQRHGFYANCESIAVDWLNLSNRRKPFAVDFNYAPLSFIPTRYKFRSNAQHYRALEVPSTRVLSRLALYLSQCDEPAMPWIDCTDWETTVKMLELCEDAGCAGVFIYIWGDGVLSGISESFQASQLTAALAAWSK